MTTVVTVGHSTHEPDAFVALLRGAGVETIADVRRFPGSRRLPWFAAEAMERWLGEAGVGYAHLPELGGRRKPAPDSPNGGWRVRQFQGYADHMAGDEFAAGLRRLIELAGERRTAAMCAEAQWWRCHRRLVADALLVRGLEVLHLGSGGKPEAHRQTDFAVVDGERLTYPPAQQELGS